MNRRAALALVRAPSFRPGLALPTVRRPSLRGAAIALGVVAGLALAYGVARETPLFAVRAVELQGENPRVVADLRAVLAEVKGESLVALDRGELERRLRAAPSVRDARVDRAFPHTLTIAVTPERPLAVVREGPKAWLVAETGRVVRAIAPPELARLPRIRVELERAPRVGSTLEAVEVRDALDVLRRARAGLAPGVLYASVAEGEVELVLRDRLAVRLGPALDVEAKLAAARAVLASLTPEEREVTGYVDVSVPERVVAGLKSQPESES